MEMTVVLDTVLDRLRHVRLDASVPDVHIRGVSHRSPNALPIVFDPS
jgi:hypothetical protein